MDPIPLQLPPLSVPGFRIQRGTLQWLRDEGADIRPGDSLAWCQLSLAPEPGPARVHPLRDEARDFQAVLVATAAGNLVRNERSQHGGILDVLAATRRWDAEQTVGWLQSSARASVRNAEGSAGGSATRVVMLAGRRFVEAVEMRGSLGAGWFDRLRAWWGEGAGPRQSVLALGVCELQPLFLGDSQAFLELAALSQSPFHAVHVRDNLLVPAAPVLLSQLRRTDDERRQMADCFLQLFQGQRSTNEVRIQNGRWSMAQDWTHFSAILTELTRVSPILERHTIVDARGLHDLGPANTVVLSLVSESTSLFRHRRLGFSVAMHGIRTSELSDEIKAWLRREFELCRRSVDEVKKDLRDLCAEVRSRTGARVLMLNAMSSQGTDAVYDYSLFEAPLARHAAGVFHQELNLAVEELQHEGALEVLDVDALAVELGGREGVPDQMHHSGELQTRMRGELMRRLVTPAA
jgi:hypothetical protein